MISVSISVDVPDMAAGIRFYESAFGFTKAAEPIPDVVVLHTGSTEICLLEKQAGSRPSTSTEETRHYDRHWTPVHMDFHVDDFDAALARALGAGAKQEQIFRNRAHPAVAFCSDPFGHGFCLIERRKSK